jgi:hypothetical protein
VIRYLLSKSVIQRVTQNTQNYQSVTYTCLTILYYVVGAFEQTDNVCSRIFIFNFLKIGHLNSYIFILNNLCYGKLAPDTKVFDDMTDIPEFNLALKRSTEQSSTLTDDPSSAVDFLLDLATTRQTNTNGSIEKLRRVIRGHASDLETGKRIISLTLAIKSESIEHLNLLINSIKVLSHSLMGGITPEGIFC